MPLGEPEQFSLGVTALLDEMLAKENAREEDEAAYVEPGPQSPGGPGCEQPEPGPGEEALLHALQRTGRLCDTLNSTLSRQVARAPPDVHFSERHKGGFVFSPGASFCNTSDSLGDALRANEDALQRVRAGILEELAQRGLSADGDPDGGLNDTGGEGDLAALLAECDAIQAVASRWRGLEAPPPGWRQLMPGELGGR